MSVPTAGALRDRRGGKKRTAMPIALKRRSNWSSTTSASVPTTISVGRPDGASVGSVGTIAARHASSPCVKVVSIPLPE